MIGRVASVLLLLLGVSGIFSPVSAQQWTRYQPQGAGYRIEFPGSPQRQTQGPSIATQYVAFVEIDQRLFMTVHQVSAFGTVLPEAGMDAARQAVLRGFQGTLRDEERLHVSGTPARRWIIDADNAVVLMLAVLKRDRFYQVMYSGPPGTETSADAGRFVASFALTDP